MPASNQGREPTASSVRSCVAPASGSGSYLALGPNCREWGRQWMIRGSAKQPVQRERGSQLDVSLVQ
jgi:hypothetical protein